MRAIILPYNMRSQSGRDIANAMHSIRIKRENSKYRYKEDDVIINWGCPERPENIVDEAYVVNKFDTVKVASNKLSALEAMARADVSIPPFTTSKDIAHEWLDDGFTVVARHVLNGHGGGGIELIEDSDDMDECDAPLYTRYIKKKSEYRVHVAFGQVIDVTRKILDPALHGTDVDWRIRNHDKGFIFTRISKVKDNDGNELEEMNVVPDSILRQAKYAVRSLGLDFGAVDIIWNDHYKTPYVLEVNTAPGIADTALTRYSDAFKRHMDSIEEAKEVVGRMVERKRIAEIQMPEGDNPADAWIELLRREIFHAQRNGGWERVGG